MPAHRSLPRSLALSCLCAAALAPSALAAGSQEITVSTDLRCTPGGPSSLSLTGTVDATTTPGEPITVRDLKGFFKTSTGIPFIPTFPVPPPLERAYPRLHGFSLSVAGGTTDATAFSGPPRALGPARAYSVSQSSGDGYEVSIPSIELPPVAAAGDGPLALRFASIAVSANYTRGYDPADPGDLAAPSACVPLSSTPSVAVVKGTAPLPGAPTLAPLDEPRGPRSGGNLVTLRGTNLTYVKDVRVGTSVVRVGAGLTVKDDRTIEVRMPGQFSSPDDVQVKVVSEFGESGSIPYEYGYAPFPLPTVTDVSPERIAKSAGTFDLVVDGTRLNRARSFRVGNVKAELLSANEAGTQARIRVVRDSSRSFSESVYSDQLDVIVESDDGCNDLWSCFSENTPADDVRLHEPTSDLPGYPQAPTNVQATRSGDQVTLTWDAAPGGSTTRYEIYQSTPSQPQLSVPAEARTATARLYSPQFGGLFFVRAVDAAGNQSFVGEPVRVAGDDPAVTPDPAYLRAQRGADPTTAVIDFGEVFGQNFEIYLDGTKVRTVYRYSRGGTVILEGLTPNAEHRIAARTVSGSGVVGPLGQPVVIPALDCDDCGADVAVDYAVKGSATIKTLAKGTAPLTGSLTGGTFIGGTGAFTADLALAQASVRLTAYGFLPVTAKLAIVSSSKLTGTLTGDALKATVKARVKLPSVSLFGIPLAGGTTCQTRSISTIELASTGAFSATKGGTIGGKFPISDLSGCGVLGGIVSPLTAGTNNAISLTLSPR